MIKHKSLLKLLSFKIIHTYIIHIIKLVIILKRKQEVQNVIFLETFANVENIYKIVVIKPDTYIYVEYI